MRWTVKENDTCACPGMQLDDLPASLPPNIRVARKNHELHILSENVAGVLPCKNCHEIIIEPKYKKIKPLELLGYIGNVVGIAVNRERLQRGEGEIEINTIASAFVQQLKYIATNTRKFERKPIKTETQAVVGKVDWLQTLRQRYAGKKNVFVSTVQSVSFDIKENALLAAAAKRVINFYSSSDEEYTILLPWVLHAEKYKHTNRELREYATLLTEAELSGARAYYYAPIILAKMILGLDGITMLSEEENAILFNMPGLYEDFIRTGFQRIGSAFDLTIQKGFSPRSFLVFEGECELIPDIAIYKGTTLKALLDVKYKKPDSKDYYQIYAYMRQARIDTAYIISPAVEDGKVYNTFDGGRIFHVRVDSSAPAFLEEQAKKMIRGI